MYKLTEAGTEKVKAYIRELKAKRKEILDAEKDTADSTNIPTLEDILNDLEAEGVDDDGEYYNGWGVTDNYDADYPLSLEINIDFVEIN